MTSGTFSGGGTFSLLKYNEVKLLVLLGFCVFLNHLNMFISREKLKQLIEKRIGKENFIEKLGFISKHELYSRASQKPQPNFPSPEYMIFDHEFTKLVKELEGKARRFTLILIRIGNWFWVQILS